MADAVAPSDSLREARDALAQRDWARAYQLLTAAAAEGELPGEDLQLLAEAAFWTCHHPESLKASERAFAAYLEVGDARAAGLVALEIARERQNRLELSLASAWFGRAAALLEGEPDSREFGHLLLARASGAQAAGELDQAYELADRSVEFARRFGDRDLEALALQRQGGVLLARGEVDEGLALIDRATLAAVAGELSTLTTAIVYCRTIGQCRELADHRRAGEWTEAATQWCERSAVTGFPGICRVHRAGIMRLRGAWTDAEAEARRACDELKGFALGVAGEAFYEIGEIRLRLGDLGGAAEAFREAHRLGREPQPGLALLRLAQGDPVAAGVAIRRAVEDEEWDRLARARLLPARVEIALAAGEAETARAATLELEAIAETYGSPAIQAEADHARGRLLLHDGDPGEAARFLKRAVQGWTTLDMPYEAARARVGLARAYRAQGDEEGAALELETARAAFDGLGAALDVGRVDALAAERMGSAPAQRTSLTFMFTDIVRSTHLVEALGDEAWGALLAWHDQRLRSLFAAHGGREVNHTGDGFFVGFDQAEPAIECAAAIQRTLTEQRREHGFAPEVRIGLHSAEAEQRGRGFGGRGVHEAARIAALAAGGEILASRVTLGTGAPRYRLSEPRAVELKGFSEPVEVVAIDWRASA